MSRTADMALLLMWHSGDVAHPHHLLRAVGPMGTRPPQAAPNGVARLPAHHPGVELGYQCVREEWEVGGAAAVARGDGGWGVPADRGHVCLHGEGLWRLGEGGDGQ